MCNIKQSSTIQLYLFEQTLLEVTCLLFPSSNFGLIVEIYNKHEVGSNKPG